MSSNLVRKLMALSPLPLRAPATTNLMRDAVQGLRPPTPFIHFDFHRAIFRNEIRAAIVAFNTSLRLHVSYCDLFESPAHAC